MNALRTDQAHTSSKTCRHVVIRRCDSGRRDCLSRMREAAIADTNRFLTAALAGRRLPR